MKLTRLRLLGFKSFVEPTDFLIEPGLTGVVGPNGCGKSNLVEALRWVMGETSHKSLRAADMDDVIFAGTNNRPARNNAEVAIQIDNGERKAPAQFNEHDTLDVSRRIEREAGSTYRINGREVRARDVQILFADASTGSRSPAMVHQGRIGEIIQAKPEQRRRVLEEAAGISGLHARRHEAELRLRGAEQNLARLEDVINQLAAQMDALKRQARQAIRYRAVAQQVRKAEATLFHLRWVAANAELAEAEHAKNAAVRMVAERTGEQAEASKRQATGGRRTAGHARGRGQGRRRLAAADSARETLEREETRARDRMAELDRRLVQLDDDIERERRLAADAEAALARLAGEEDTLQREASANEAQRAGVDQRVAEADAVLATSEKTADELTGTLADLTARRNALETAAREHGDRIGRLTRRDRRRRRRSSRRSKAPQRADLAALAAAAEASEAAVAEAEAAAAARRSRAFRRPPGARRRARTARRGRAPGAASRHRSQDAGEASAHRHQESLAGGDRRAHASTKATKPRSAPRSATTSKRPIDPSAPMRWAGAAIDPTDPALPDGVEALADHVKAPQELARRLAQIGVIGRERGRAPRAAAQARPAAGFARGRSLALGWILGRRQCADRRRPPSGRQEPPDRYRGGARRLAPGGRRRKQTAVTAAETEVTSAAEAEAAARTRWRSAAARSARGTGSICRGRT